ncbi:uncharacterized protein LOC124152004 [Haliotis rufescens]|uniref:uncharacterized protein LOC124152004 n=1 Tax=Haliotis rufescens TaxID=6454 RepID=UPI00201E90D3|nr:uncharacterized protein LOC124152004 [Haliotis rufescens]
MTLKAVSQCGASTWRPRYSPLIRFRNPLESSRNRGPRTMDVHTVQGPGLMDDIRFSSLDFLGMKHHMPGDLSQLSMLIVMVAGCVLFYTCLMFCIVTLDRQMCRRQTHIGRKVKQLMLHLLKMPRFAKIFTKIYTCRVWI